MERGSTILRLRGLAPEVCSPEPLSGRVSAAPVDNSCPDSPPVDDACPDASSADDRPDVSSPDVWSVDGSRSTVSPADAWLGVSPVGDVWPSLVEGVSVDAPEVPPGSDGRGSVGVRWALPGAGWEPGGGVVRA